VKSAEEIDWMRIGAYFTDLGMAGPLPQEAFHAGAIS
jgi:hypothetical protein